METANCHLHCNLSNKGPIAKQSFLADGATMYKEFNMKEMKFHKMTMAQRRAFYRLTK